MTRKVIGLLVLGLAIPACNGGPAGDSASAGDRVEAVGAEEVVYVDVRTPEEFASGHVAGAINIPHTEMRDRHGELEPYADRPMVLYCRSGRRSGIAREILEDEGFTDVVNGGAFRDLQARGVPTER